MAAPGVRAVLEKQPKDNTRMTSIIINKVIDRVIHVLERWRGTPHIPDWYYREEAEWERVNKCGETSAASSDCPRCSGLEEKVKKHNADYDGLQLIIERQRSGATCSVGKRTRSH
jgi:hypothetical protein